MKSLLEQFSLERGRTKEEVDNLSEVEKFDRMQLSQALDTNWLYGSLTCSGVRPSDFLLKSTNKDVSTKRELSSEPSILHKPLVPKLIQITTKDLTRASVLKELEEMKTKDDEDSPLIDSFSELGLDVNKSKD